MRRQSNYKYLRHLRLHRVNSAKKAINDNQFFSGFFVIKLQKQSQKKQKRKRTRFMELNNGFDFDESRLDEIIATVLDQSRSNHESGSSSDINKFVNVLWEKVGKYNSNTGIETTTTTRNNSTNVVNDSNSCSSSSSAIQANDSPVSSNTSTVDVSSNIHDFITELDTSLFNEQNHTTEKSQNIISQPTATAINDRVQHCCKNDAMAKQLVNLTNTEFMNRKSEILRIIKLISLKTQTDQMYFYYFDSSIHVKTNSLISQIQGIKKTQYVICEGFKQSLLFCDQLLTINNFLYFTLLSQVQIVSLHTVANLCMNHLATNRLPLYMSLDAANESKFVRTFLKLTKFELHYNSIKHRITSIIKHAPDCNLLK